MALILAQPVPIGDAHGFYRQCPTRTDDDPRLLGLDSNDVERLLLSSDLDAAALADGEMDDAVVATKNLAIDVYNLARRLRFGTEPLDEAGIVPVGNEADVLAVGLRSHFKPEVGRDPADFIFGQVAKRKAQEIELPVRRPVKEVALVPARIGSLVELDPVAVDQAAHIMARRQAIGAKLARECNQIDELHALVAARAGHGRAATGIFVDKVINHTVADSQWVNNLIVPDTHYVFAHLDQMTTSLTGRLNFTVSPTLSLQLYGEPFVSGGDYRAFRELVDGRNLDYASRYAPFDYNYAANGIPDFNVKSFRTTNVLRWEYRPGSTLFVVWQQARQSDLGAGGFRLGRDARGIFGVPPHNVFLVKLAYWLNA